jgi:dUTP pyrophosphatase
MLVTKFKKLTKDTPTPEYCRSEDAALDLTATSVSFTEDYVEYGLGLALQIESGHVGLIFPRSSISKYDLSLCNSVGVIDSGYRGEVKARFKITKKDNPKVYEVGDRVCQLMVIPFPYNQMKEVEEINETERGSGGFGSSNP